MTDRPRPGGYLDRDYLARARRANRSAVDLACRLVDGWDRMGPAQRLLLLAQLGIKLAEQGQSLGEMELLRERWVSHGKKAAGSGANEVE